MLCLRLKQNSKIISDIIFNLKITLAYTDKDLSDRESKYNGRQNVDCKREYDSEDELCSEDDNNPICKMNSNKKSCFSVLNSISLIKSFPLSIY